MKIFKYELTAREKVTSQCDSGPQSDIPYSASNLFTRGIGNVDVPYHKKFLYFRQKPLFYKINNCVSS